MSMIMRVLFDFVRQSVSVLLSRANTIYAGLNQNPAYPNPPVSMPELRMAIDNLAAADSAFDGGAKAKALRNTHAESLTRMLRKLARYVEIHCNDDMNTLLSSGFQPAVTTSVKRPPLTEAIRKVDPGPESGQLSVELVAVPGAASYELRWAQLSGGTTGDWATRSAAGVRGLGPLKGLIPGATYVLQARALTRTGFTPWSDSLTRICT